MIPLLTDAQEALLKTLRLANTDNRAIQVIEAAFAVRNAAAPHSLFNLTESVQELSRVVDEVAG